MKALIKSLIPAVLIGTVIACSSGEELTAPCEPGLAANEYTVYSAAIEEFSRGVSANP